MSNIEKYKTQEVLVNEINSIIKWRDGTSINFRIGDWISNDGNFYQITDVKEYCGKKHDDSEYTYTKIILIDSNGKESDLSLDSLIFYNYVGSSSYSLEVSKDSIDLLEGKTNVEKIAERLEGSYESNSTDLMVMNTNVLKTKKDSLEQTKRHIRACTDRAERLLKERLSGLSDIVRGFEKQIKKLEKLIFTIELYEGISEEIHHFKIGANASEDAYLTIRQRKLFMDEEVGDPTDGGLDFETVDDFDKWLLQKNSYWNCYNYEFIVPEDKCVVALAVRREDKKYTDNPFINKIMNQENDMCYLLIRNGENLYRIYSKLIIGEKMFPDSGELLKFQQDYENERWDSRKDEIDNKIDRFKFNMILLQGIIERTECFPHEKYTQSLFKMTDDTRIKFFYDDDYSKMLPTNMVSFSGWVNSKNKGTEVGSQILWFDSSIGWKKESDRMFREIWRRHEDLYPNNPTTGLYTLEPDRLKRLYWKEEKDILYFKYDPQRHKHRYWYESDDDKPRVKRVSFLFDSEHDYYINYDNITRDDMEKLDFYIHTRLDRRFYLTKIPMLLEMKKLKEKEFAEEDNFIKLALVQSGLDVNKDFQKGIDAMQWWKTKNKWKRCLKSDDTKALRMIIKELKKKN